MPATFLWCVPLLGACLGSAQHLFIQLPFVLSRNKKREPSQLTLGADSKLPWGIFHCLLFSPQSDQIDENLKLALQQDLTTMAPGLIIQVINQGLIEILKGQIVVALEALQLFRSWGISYK